MTEPKLIMSQALIEQLVASGTVSKYCTEFIIHAKLGEPILLYEAKFATDVILSLPLVETIDPAEAVAR